jgi:hypothetical protein
LDSLRSSKQTLLRARYLFRFRPFRCLIRTSGAPKTQATWV